MNDNNQMEQTPEESLISKSLPEIQKASGVLAANKKRAETAVVGGNIILNAIQENQGKMTAGLDDRAQTFLNRASTAVEEMNDARKPYTQLLDLIKKEFTAAENLLDPKTPGTISHQLQGFRNAYAKEVHEEQQAKAEEARKEQEKLTELANIKAEMQRQLLDYVSLYISLQVKQLQDLYNTIQLGTFDDLQAQIAGYNVAYSYQHYTAFKYNPSNRLQYHTDTDIKLLYANIILPNFEEHANTVITKVTEYRDLKLADLPELKGYLERQAAADADTAKAMEAKRKADQDAETERKRKEDEQAKIDAAQKIDLEHVADTTEAQFAGMHVMGPVGPESRKGYEVILKHPAAALLIVKAWYDHEGKDLAVDKIMKVSIEKMCKVVAELHEDGIMKIDSQYIEYKETITAVNRKKRKLAK